MHPIFEISASRYVAFPTALRLLPGFVTQFKFLRVADMRALVAAERLSQMGRSLPECWIFQIRTDRLVAVVLS
jgi:hypothetical protein